ncbi:MAG TPA: VWA domain-containing protein [Saprospiraceae bacterium]|nr:VWA domain-containing protein [Saprospiraceae bacterium]
MHIVITSLLFIAHIHGAAADRVRVLEETPSPLIFILDASGSMWGKIGQEHKITIARDVLGDLISNIEPSREIGLVAYGHRQKNACDDIEWLLKPGASQRTELSSALRNLNPTGMTPLAQSASMVIETLKEADQSATIILITDGLETCKGDLCIVVAEAKAAGVDFVMHIVGFDLGESDKSKLECAAREGNGLYIDAANSAELDSALNQATELTIENTGATLSIGTTKAGVLIDASVNIFRSGTREYIAGQRTYTDKATNPRTFHLPPGIYDVNIDPVGLHGIQPIILTRVTISEDSITERTVDFSSGKLAALVTSNGELHDASISIQSQSKTTNTAGGRSYNSPESNPSVIELNPDRYTVTVRSIRLKGPGYEQVFRDVDVLPGERVDLKCEIPHGVLQVGATHDGNLWDCTIYVVSTQTKQAAASGRTYTSASNNPKTILLTPGSYEVTLKPLKLETKQQTITVEIKEGQTVEHMFNF